ncbi:hypothetical protein HDU67_006016, partial [Dinochytrium kinnereticum]
MKASQKQKQTNNKLLTATLATPADPTEPPKTPAEAAPKIPLAAANPAKLLAPADAEDADEAVAVNEEGREVDVERMEDVVVVVEKAARVVVDRMLVVAVLRAVLNM